MMPVRAWARRVSRHCIQLSRCRIPHTRGRCLYSCSTGMPQSISSTSTRAAVAINDNVADDRIKQLRNLLERISDQQHCTEEQHSLVISALRGSPSHTLPSFVHQLSAAFRFGPPKKRSLTLACILKLEEYLHENGDILRVFQLVNHLQHVQPLTAKDTSATGRILKAVTRALRALPEEVILSDDEVCVLLVGLQHSCNTDPGVRDLLREVCKRMPERPVEPQSDVSPLAAALFGLQSMRDDCCEVQKALEILSGRIDSFSGQIPMRAMSYMLTGLTFVDKANEHAEKVLRAVANGMRRHCGPANIHNLSSVLFGLRHVSPKSPGARAVMSEAAKWLQTAPSDYSWTGRTLSRALFGLRDMSDDTPEFRDLLVAMLSKVDKLDKRIILDDKSLGMAFNGLRGTKIDGEGSRHIVRLLTEAAACCPQPLSQKSLSMALQGLSGDQSGCMEVRSLLSLLAVKLKAQPIPATRITPAGIALAFCSMKNFSIQYPEVSELLSVLTEMLEACVRSFSPKDVIVLLGGLHVASSGQSDLSDVSERALFAIERRVGGLDMTFFKGDELAKGLGELYAVKSPNEYVKRIRMLFSAALARQSSLSAREISQSLFALKGISEDDDDVDTLVKTLTDKMNESVCLWGSRELSNALHGLAGLNAGSNGVKELLCALRMKLVEFSMDEEGYFCSGQAFSMALHGLQRMNSQVDEVNHLLSALYPILAASRRVPLCETELRSSFYGLKSMSTDSDVVLKILELLVDRLERIETPLSPTSIAYILQGSNGMSCELPVVRRLATRLALDCGNLTDTAFSAKQLGNCFYGLQSMSLDTAEVEQLVSALIVQLERCPDPFGHIFFASTLFGIRNLKTNHPLMQRLLQIITTKISASTSAFGEWTIGNTLYGMQNMSSQDGTVRSLLRELNKKISETGSMPMTSQGIGNALYGLQCMDADAEEVDELLLLLLNKMRHSSAEAGITLNPQEVGNAIFGLGNMSVDNPHVSEIFEFLYNETLSCVELFEAMPAYNWERWVRVLIHSITLTMPRVAHIYPTIANKFIEAVPQLEALLLDSEAPRRRMAPPAHLSATRFSSATEMRMFNVLQAHYKQDTTIKITSNEYLHGFEADIVLSVPTKRGNVVVNVEVDGALSHTLLTSRRFQELRDAHLRGLGVAVVRLSGTSLRNFSAAEFSKSVLEPIVDKRNEEII